MALGYNKDQVVTRTYQDGWLIYDTKVVILAVQTLTSDWRDDSLVPAQM